MECVMPNSANELKIRIVGVALAASLALSGASAQEDGTAGTVPETPETCTLVASELGTNPSASPVAATPMSATPVSATPVSATPVAADDHRTTDLETGINTILRCMSKNDAERLLQVTSPQFRANWIGMGAELPDEDFNSLMNLMPRLPYEMVSTSNITWESDTNATVTVVYTVGRQMHTENWTMSLATVGGMNVWKVDSSSAMATEAPADAGTIKLTIDDTGFTFDPTEVVSGNVVVQVENTGSNPHEALILRVPAEVSTADILSSPTGIPDGVTFIGQATIPAGESGTIVLKDLRPGTYTVVDLLPDSAGMPNLSNGMITTFEVTRP